jgi:hypothetical protein
MPPHLIPSNATIQAIKPGDSRQRLGDGAGLYVLLFVKGGSHGWRFDYTFKGKRKTLSLGTYPATGLALARKDAAEARRKVREGVDPSADRQERRAEEATQRLLDELADAGIAPPGTRQVRVEVEAADLEQAALVLDQLNAGLEPARGRWIASRSHQYQGRRALAAADLMLQLGCRPGTG